MAWSIDTFAGLRASGSNPNWTLALFELCRALNERQTALGITKTQFIKNDGTYGSDLALSDLQGLKISGIQGDGGGLESTNWIVGNLDRISLGIKSLINSAFFTEGSGKTDAWTLANLYAEIGYDIPDSPVSAQDAAHWQGLRDALDLMIHATRGIFPTWIGVDNLRLETDTLFIEDPQDAWDDMIGEATPTSTPNTGLNGWVFTKSKSDPTYYYRGLVVLTDDSAGDSPIFDLSNVRGILRDVWYRIAYTKTLSTNYQTGALTIKIGSTNCAQSGFTGTAANGDFQGATSDYTLEMPNSIAVDGLIPATVPFSIPDFSSPPSSITANLQGQVSYATVYHDIDSLLTDQAI